MKNKETTVSIKTFQDLIAWQKAMQLAKTVYTVTRTMPDDEKFGLTAQMRRAAVAIPSNIAEGYGRQSLPDYLRFLKIARGSLMELQTQLLLIETLALIPITPELKELLGETDRVLQALIRSLDHLRK